MNIAQTYITESAQCLLETNALAKCAYNEICIAISAMADSINNSEKNCNGVVPLKEPCYQKLEDHFGWYREKPLAILKKKGGPIDIYKLFSSKEEHLAVGIEFETGNISSAHRSMNKLSLGVRRKELDLAVLLLPMHKLSYYLTDRVSNYEELLPYFPLIADIPFIFIGFDVEKYSETATRLPKGSDGMSKRSLRKWKEQY